MLGMLPYTHGWQEKKGVLKILNAPRVITLAKAEWNWPVFLGNIKEI